MNVKIEEIYKIGDSLIGIRLYNVQAIYFQHHIAIALFPINIGIMVVPFKRLNIELKFFKYLSLHFGIGRLPA
tara:strand:- start:325 stop:543 length:219 start_codon:yes stop_codon:yes gene_type:complete